MIIYSFFLKVKNDHEYTIMKNFSHILQPTYKGFHPVINNGDGTYYILYAMTASKKKKDLFIKSRDMKKFKYFKSEVTQEKASLMFDSLSDTVLKISNLNDGPDKIDFCMTEFERETISDEFTIIEKISDIFLADSNENWSLCYQDVLKKSVNETLSVFKFKPSLDLVYIGGANDGDVEISSEEYLSCLNDLYDHVIINTFELFIDLFGNTLSVKGE